MVCDKTTLKCRYAYFKPTNSVTYTYIKTTHYVFATNTRKFKRKL